MAKSHRAQRVEEAIRESVALAVLTELKDPRIPLVFNITGCRVTPDLQLARIYFSQVPDDAESVEETLRVLERAEGVLRGCIGRAIRLRTSPRLEFHFDESQKRAARVEELLKEARASGTPPSGSVGEE